MKKNILSLIAIMFYSIAFSQNERLTNDPSYSSRRYDNVDILKVELKDDISIIRLNYDTRRKAFIKKFKNGYIVANGKKYKAIRSDLDHGAPNTKNEDIGLNFYFKPIPLGIETIDICIDIKSYGFGFGNFYPWHFFGVEINNQKTETKKENPSNSTIKSISKTEEIIPSDVDLDIPVIKQINNKTFAVIIANENYKEEDKVQFAINDGKVFKEYCEKTLGIPSANIHFAQDATFGKMKSEIKWISDVISTYNGQAKVIFYYAGHGMPNENDTSSYLLPVDGFSGDFETAIKLQDLYNRLSQSPSQNVTVFLDACFSGSKRENGMLANGRSTRRAPKGESLKGNMVVFSASTGQETAYPYKEKQHGLFTYFLLKKLQETKGNVNYEDLSKYIIENVSQQSVVVNQKSQTPQVNKSFEMENLWKQLKLK
jgi:hypothetical protein